MPDRITDREKAAAIIRDAGGEIVGRTRLQKVGFLLKCAGLEDRFDYEYHYYGPFSQELADGVRIGRAFGLVTEDECTADWGGTYSIYRTTPSAPSINHEREAFANVAAKVGAIELELAATAAYLKLADYDDPWHETARRKPEKATPKRIKAAKAAYAKLLGFDTPQKLPAIL